MAQFRTDTKALILAILQTGPKHGYAISKEIRAISEEVLKLGEGQLYPVLRDLEDQGLIAGEWEHTPGEPARKIYAISPAGRGNLVERIKEWRKFTNAVSTVLSQPEPKNA